MAATDFRAINSILSRLDGGYDSVRPLTRIPEGKTPYCSNVLFDRSSVRKRPGFTPLFREQLKLNSIEGVSNVRTGRMVASGNERPFRHALGYGFAPHRDYYTDTKDDFLVQFVFTPSNLEVAHGGNAVIGGAATRFNTLAAPNDYYPIQLRPVLSKGPLKRGYAHSAEQNLDDTATPLDAWTPGVWGGASDYATATSRVAMPFCIYMWNGSGEWVWRASWHEFDTNTGNWSLVTLQDTTPIRVGQPYHVIFSVTTGVPREVNFRVGQLLEGSTSYTMQTVAIDATEELSHNDCPILFFDAPQPFVEEDGSVAGFHRPGLNLGGANAGGVHYACMRAEGKLEDVSYHRLGVVTSITPELMDRPAQGKLDFTADPNVLSYWPIDGTGRGVIRDVSPLRNDAVLGPAGPTYVPGYGVRNGAWAFNGRTSYALADLHDEHPNYRWQTSSVWIIYHNATAGTFTLSYRGATTGNLAWNETVANIKTAIEGLTGAVAPKVRVTGTGTQANPWVIEFFNPPRAEYVLTGDPALLTFPAGNDDQFVVRRPHGWLQHCVLNNRNWGIGITFWPGSIEPNYEQVLYEIHGVIRMSIGRDGRLRVRTRNTAAVNADGDVWSLPVYDTVRTSNAFLRPGERYNVQLYRVGTTTAELLVNGIRDSQFTLDLCAGEGHPLGGITWGIGSYYQTTWWSRKPGDGSSTTDTWMVSTDARSAFCGIIESVEILAGPQDETQPVATRVATYKDLAEGDMTLRDPAHWILGDNDTAALAQQNDSVTSTSAASSGRIFHPPSHERIAYPIAAVSASSRQYDLATRVLPLPAQPQGSGEDNADNPPISAFNALAMLRHAKTWFVAARWVFDEPDNDLWYGGSYRTLAEWISGAAQPSLPNGTRYIHEQVSTVTSETPIFGVGDAYSGVVRRCLEGDEVYQRYNQTDSEGMSGTRNVHANRPYALRTPRELMPQYADGELWPLCGTNPTSALTEYSHLASKKRFTITGCGRGIYWSRPIWTRGSPYPGEDHILVPSVHGPAGGRILIESSHNEQGWTSGQIVTFECWLRPDRLDGRRLVALKGVNLHTTTPGINYCIYLEDGQVRVIGTLDSNTKAWLHIAAGTFIGPSTYLPQVLMRLNEWNHLHVAIGFNGSSTKATIHVNGRLCQDFSIADAITSGTPDGLQAELHLLDLPRGRRTVTFNWTSTPLVLDFLPFSGAITDFRSENATNPLFPHTANGRPPKSRLSAGGNTYYMFPFNEGSGWGATNQSGPGAGDDAKLLIREHIRIGTLEHDPITEREADQGRFDAKPFRDVLWMTNGKERPLRIEHRYETHPLGPFAFSHSGLMPPALPYHASTSTLANPTLGYKAIGAGARFGGTRVYTTNIGTGQFAAQGIRTFMLTFVDEEAGIESDPIILANVEVGPNEVDAFRITDLPVSFERRVTGRRIYTIVPGSRTPILHLELHDNVSQECELIGDPSQGSTELAGSRLPPPMARHLVVVGNELVYSHLTGSPNGPLALQWTNGPEYAPLENSVVIDAEQGDAILGSVAIHSRSFHFTRKGIWEFLPGFGGPRSVNKGTSMGGALVHYGDLVYGAGERGVHIFDGSEEGYAGHDLEGVWGDLDLSDEGIIAWVGVYDWLRDMYWISARTRGSSYLDRTYTMERGGDAGPIWAPQDLPPHTVMVMLIDAPGERGVLAIGTTSGQILRSNESLRIDGHDLSNYGEGAVPLTGAGSNFTPTSIDVVFALPLVGMGAGLRGCKLRIRTTENPEGEVVTIESNSRFTMRWRNDIPVGTNPTIELCGIDALWSSGYIAWVRMGAGADLLRLDIDFDPVDNVLDLFNVAVPGPADEAGVAVVRELDPGDCEQRPIDMELGYLEESIGVNSRRGRYHRVMFRNNKPNEDFSIVAIGFRADESGVLGLGRR